jgi:hypothetical protein
VADFGIYLNVTNHSGMPLFYQGSNPPDPAGGKPDYPPVIPDNSTGQIHIPADSPAGAEGTVTYANDGPQDRSYTWSAACSTFNPDNHAQGPGVTSYNRSGHPLKVIIDV